MKTINNSMYKGQTVAVVGYGAEGESAYQYYAARGADVTIVDESINPHRPIPKDAKTILGADSLAKIKHFDIVSRTPPLRPDKIKTFGRVTSVTREFFSECPAPIIGVTGTKGKGTTTTLIAEILKKAGKTVHLLGNVGQPALNEINDIESDHIVCYELSSFQLWDADTSPETAVVLMVEPEHLDIHTDLQEYIDAKKGITRYQQKKDLVIFHPNNPRSAEIAGVSPANKLQYMSEKSCFIRGEDIVIGEHKICSINETGLLGPHNLENICAAVTAAWQYAQDLDAIGHTVKHFKGLEHRLEFIREVQGARFYNDSYSSAVVASAAAIRSFPGDTQVLILGGKDKKNDYGPVFEEILEHDVRRVILFGENQSLLSEALTKIGYLTFERVLGDITEVVEKAQEVAFSGDVVIFSPGTSSYDMFKNYKHRGEEFRRAVKNLK